MPGGVSPWGRKHDIKTILACGKGDRSQLKGFVRYRLTNCRIPAAETDTPPRVFRFQNKYISTTPIRRRAGHVGWRAGPLKVLR
jgi:hypothetical protein